MAKIRTHYDNLQVARTASDEVIRASYRTLSQKYHPDKNGNNQSTSERWMKIINEAYAVLSDPEKRSLHDEWIVRMEAAQQEPSNTAHPKRDQATQQSAENLVNPKEFSWLLYSKAAWIALLGTLVSVFDPPYSFYSYLHFIFFVVSVFGIYLIGKERHIASFFLILVALIFNPIASLTLGGVDHNSWDLWLLLNIISLVPIFYVRHELLAMASGARTDAWLERELLKNEPSTSSVDFTLSYRSLLITSLLAAAAGMGALWTAVHNAKGELGTDQIIVVGGAIGGAVAGFSFLSIWIYRLNTKTPDEDYRLVRQALSKKIEAALFIFSIMVAIGYLYFLPIRKASYEVAQQAATPVTGPTQATVTQGDPVDAIAQNNLGNRYYAGQGVAQDYALAVYWYRKAADQGDAPAQLNLGNLYEAGQGVAQDYFQAVYWFRKAADQGLAEGQTNLGIMYAKGQGVTRDYALAVQWFRKGAEQGLALGQYDLGYMYANGQGVVQDYAQAVYWYRKAADQGNASAKYNLSIIANRHTL